MSSVTKEEEEIRRTKPKPNSKPPRPKRIIFSFESYANDLIQRMKSSNVVIEQGLSDTEFSSLESKFNFTFPPDLRLILQQGLPISPGFPNWRSASQQQLRILLDLPLSSILRTVSNNRFWHPSWGPLPKDAAQSIQTILDAVPRLVPIYQSYYIPSSPNVIGNPIFYVDHGGHVRLDSFDVAGFVRRAEFLSGVEAVEPVWAATKARTIEFWSEMADGRGWKWWWDERKGELGECMDDVLRKLREGGWKEEEIRDMMMMMKVNQYEQDKRVFKDKKEIVEHVHVHVRDLSLMLLRGGWSREDVLYSLGVQVQEQNSFLDLEF
ncbi:uncharacterized protein [Cicer arietinum]|uniref:Uncharacterized protein LOC101499545 n=1 Tax=Cicer arietinum TaxID=3827 RepID=A0A1S2YZ44_CICAR|nr:uncharacterized protein LOC101499545 [Cicer arietinum]